MVNTEYSEAMAETLDLLSHMQVAEIEKIPEDAIEFLSDNASKNYKPKINYEDGIENLKLKPKTRAILALIYRNYLCNDDERKAYNQRLTENEKIYQQQLKKIYNSEDLFKDKQKTIAIENAMLRPVKNENIIQKIINKLQKLLSK